MGKKKDKDGSPSRKKQKKHKKHKKKRDKGETSEEIDVVNDEVDEAPLKLKIRFGSLNKSKTKISNEDEDETKRCADDKSRVVETEEDQWLDAMEKGNLNEYGEIKKEEESLSMTARQRALKGKCAEGESELVQLPMYPEKSIEENEEFERKRKLRAKKRKQEVVKKIEETKTQTIEKLLTKTQKSRKDVIKPQRKLGAHVRYQRNADGIFLSYTEGMDYPLKAQRAGSPPVPSYCAAVGCENVRKYTCSTTSLPVCSLECYQHVNAVAVS